MAQTISRPTLTDDTGTPAAPNNDGDALDAAFFTDMYDRIDGLFSAGSFQIAGTFDADALGTHTFWAGGAGGNILSVINSAAASGNFARMVLGTDARVDQIAINALTTTWTTAAPNTQDGAAIHAKGPGGLSIAADHASGDLRFYAAGVTKVATYDGDSWQLDAPAAGQYALGGVLDGSRNETSVGVDANQLEKDLHTFSLPANTLAVDGQEIEYIVWGTTAVNTQQKNVRLYFGTSGAQPNGEVLNAGGGVTTNGGHWEARMRVVRTGAATQRAYGKLFGVVGDDNDNNNAWAAVQFDGGLTETLSGAVTVKVTGQNGTSTANNIVVEGSRIVFYP